MTGRVVAFNGEPIAGALVHIRRVVTILNGKPYRDMVVGTNGKSVLQTNADGFFITPIGFDRDASYSALAEAEGYQNGRTDWVTGSSGRFPALVLQPDPKARRRSQP